MFTLPTNGNLTCLYARTLADALAVWVNRYHQVEAISEPREALTKGDYINNGWNPTGYYQTRVKYVDVRYRYSPRSRWQYGGMVYDGGETKLESEWTGEHA